MKNQKNIMCLICNVNLKRINMLSLHLKHKHNMTSKEYYDKFFKKDNDGKCKTCGKQTSFSMGKYKQFCSTKCSTNNIGVRKKIQETSLKKYGTIYPCQNKEIKEKLVKSQSLLNFKSITNKRKQTSLKRYGVDNPSKSKKIIAKIEATHRKKWGFKSSSQNPLIKEKQKQTCLKNFGVNSPLKSLEVWKKIKSTNLKKYGYEHASQNKEIKEKMDKNIGGVYAL